MKEKNDKIVCFHTGRGGRFHNPGHRTYVGEFDIQDMLNSWLADKTFINERDEKGRFSKPYVTDCSGRTVVDAEDLASGVGTIDFDGIYDSYECMRITECDRDDLEMIYDEEETWTEAYLYAEKKLMEDW